MPKISAQTVAEHVQQQHAAVIESASRLFAQRGVSQVSLADIAADVGLARNSLYRYFPDKSHLLAAWFRSELEPLQARSQDIVTQPVPVKERLVAWISLQLEYLAAPEHRAILQAVAELATLDEDLRGEIAEGHRLLYGGLSELVQRYRGEQSLDRSALREFDPEVAVMFIVGMVRTASELVAGGRDMTALRDQLVCSAFRLLDEPSTTAS